MNKYELISYRRQQSRLLASSGSRTGIRPSDVWAAVRFTLWCLWHALYTLWRLNPVSLFIRRWRQLHYLNTRMALSIRPRLADLATDFFLSAERRRRKLLSWVKSILPWVGEDILDFTACWQDGIVLCALMETISPGACPGFNLLKPHHRVNNCRLGLQLAMRYLQVTHLPLSPEEMAIADEHCEVKICHLVQLLKWKYQKQGGRPKEFSNVRIEEPFQCKCQARGTGIKAGIVGRRTKFNVLTDTVTRLDILIEIRGPNNEYNKEKIISMHNGRYKDHNSLPNIPMTEDDSKTKIIEDGAGHSFLRQRSLDEDLGHLVIPFDYQCVGEGRFLVTYIPRSAGLHYITILSQGAHIQGSPFEVKVSDWVSSWNLMPKARVVPFDMLQTIEERPKDGQRAVAPTDKLKRQMSHVAHVSKHLTMMKRRILKKVITHNGEEIICDVTPSPTLSRQSSADCSDLSEEDIRKSKHGSYRDNGGALTGSIRVASKARAKRKMLGDIDAVEETPELIECSAASAGSGNSISTENGSSPASQNLSGQSKRHLLGTIRMPKSQVGDLPNPEVVITPEDDCDGPFRLQFDSDDDLLSTEPNSPEAYDAGISGTAGRSPGSGTSHFVVTASGGDPKSRPAMKKSNSADLPSSRKASPIYKATDIVETFLDTLRQGCTDRLRRHSGSNISRGRSVDLATPLQATRVSQELASKPLGLSDWGLDKKFQTSMHSSLQQDTPDAHISLSDHRRTFSRQSSVGKATPIKSNSVSSEENTHTKKISEIDGEVHENERLQNTGCLQCDSSISFREDVAKTQCDKCGTENDAIKMTKNQKYSTDNIEHGPRTFQNDPQNFDREFIDHVTEAYDAKNMKFNGQFRPHRGSSSFDFSDFKPMHNITWSQHKDFSAERKLRKSITFPYRDQSLSDRSLFSDVTSPVEERDLDLLSGLANIDSSGSDSSGRQKEDEENVYEVTISSEEIVEDSEGEVRRERRFQSVQESRNAAQPPITAADFADRCRSDGETESDAGARRDKLAKTKKWNTFDTDARGRSGGNDRFVNIFYGLESTTSESYGRNSEEDEILQIVIETKVRQSSVSGDGNDNDSPCTESVRTGGASSKSLEENYVTSDENSPSIMLIDSGGDAPDGRGDDVVGISPFSGISNRSGNSDWSENDDATPRGGGGYFLDKDRDATRRYFLKGDWSPQFVDLYYHGDARSHHSGSRSVNAGSPSRNSYKTNSQSSSTSPVAKETPVQRRRSRPEILVDVTENANHPDDENAQRHRYRRRSSHDRNSSFLQSERVPKKTEHAHIEGDVFIPNYLNGLGSGDSPCPLYVRRRLRPQYDPCDKENDQSDVIFAPRRKESGTFAQPLIEHPHGCSRFHDVTGVHSFFSQLGLLSPAVSDHMNLVDNWSCLSSRYVPEKVHANHALMPPRVCTAHQINREMQPFRVDYFQERALTPTKYRRQREASVPSHSNAGKANRATKCDCMSCTAARFDQLACPRDEYLQKDFRSYGERTLTPTKYRVPSKMRGKENKNPKAFVAKRAHHMDDSNEAIFDWMERSVGNATNLMIGYDGPMGKDFMFTTMPYFMPCECSCCVSRDAALDDVSAPYLKKRKVSIKHESQQFYGTLRTGGKSVGQTGRLQQEQETQTPEDERELSFVTIHSSQALLSANVARTNDETQACEEGTCPAQTHNNQQFDQHPDSSIEVIQTIDKSTVQRQQQLNDERASFRDECSRPAEEESSQTMHVKNSHCAESPVRDAKIRVTEVPRPMPQIPSLVISEVESEVDNESQPNLYQAETEQVCVGITEKSDDDHVPDFRKCPEQKNTSPADQPAAVSNDNRNGQSPVVRRQSTVDTLDSGITEDGATCQQMYSSGLLDSLVADLEENFNVPMYIPPL